MSLRYPCHTVIRLKQEVYIVYSSMFLPVIQCVVYCYGCEKKGGGLKGRGGGGGLNEFLAEKAERWSY